MEKHAKCIKDYEVKTFPTHYFIKKGEIIEIQGYIRGDICLGGGFVVFGDYKEFFTVIESSAPAEAVRLIGKKITQSDLVKFSEIEKDFNFHIYGQSNRQGGGYIHTIGTNRPTSDPSDCNSYWTRRRKDGSYEFSKNNGGEHGEMCWVIMDSGDILLASIISETHIVIEYSQHIINSRGNVSGLAFFRRFLAI